MADKNPTLKIGLLLTGDYGWAGGLYYVVNIIKVLNLQKNGLLKIVVFYNNQTPIELIEEIKKLDVTIENLDKYNVIFKALFKILRLVTKRNFQLEYIINPYNLTAIYPLSQYFNNLHGLNCKIIYWIYDFQHKFLPELFNKSEIYSRDKNFGEIAKKAEYIVVSSKDAFDHFKLFYPQSNAAIYTLPFVSMVQRNELPDFSLIKQKYKIDKPYFIVANQFWVHKNHLLVLKALLSLKIKNIPVKVYFTGKQHDSRSPNHFNELSKFIEKEGLQDFVYFTGFIPREEQLSLIENAIAVIQPSKFEGWSTVVEDAKALNKYLLLSDINVHKEQARQNASFFSPDDAIVLASYIENIEFILSQSKAYNYDGDIRNFSENLLKLFSELHN